MANIRFRAAVGGVLFVCLGAGFASAHELTFEQQVQARTAIERVYHRHRIWPVENPGPKPAFESTISEATIRAAVTDSRAKEAALMKRWQRIIGADEIQAELDRIAAASRDPRMLAELFAALDDDPDLIAQVLIRPLIADRVLRSQFSRDPVIHAEARAQAARAAVEAGDGSLLQETDDAFIVATDDPMSWPKQSFDTWWRKQRARYAELPIPEETEAVFTIPSLPTGTCDQDTWAQLSSFLPVHRSEHTTVWTGTEMIVWGGRDDYYGPLNTGGRYLPATDSWLPMKSLDDGSPRYGHTAIWTGEEMLVFGGSAITGIFQRYDPVTDSWSTGPSFHQPSNRFRHTAVWTGTEMIIWGGTAQLESGGRYNPSTERWHYMSMAGEPTSRSGHVAVWTGSQMIVWGGSDATGGRYDPVSDTWTATSTANAPEGRTLAAHAWTGSFLLVWGGGADGTGSAPFATGRRYDPVADLWTPMATAGAPTRRRRATGVWTGSQFIVWGGEDYNPSNGNFTVKNDGARYSPATDSWTPTSLVGAPQARHYHTAVWTGSRMVVWGGRDYWDQFSKCFYSGGRYDPVSDSWTSTADNAPAPTPRTDAIAIWTGAEMVVWGGKREGEPFVPSSERLTTGGRYDPALDMWTPTTMVDAPPATVFDVGAVWNGDRVIVWPGGSAYRPADDSWIALSTTNAPTLGPHEVVWTGTEMLAWSAGAGGRYRPATDSWSVMSATGAPSPRSGHTAVWGGGRMIVWGGRSGNTTLCSGGRYDPGTDTWASMAGVAQACAFHSAVWSGTEMLAWGGERASQVMTTQGWRYDPVTNTTSFISNTGSPGQRLDEMAIWTSRGMLVWGGGGLGYDGGIYSPASNSWTPTNTGYNMPTRRRSALGVWTGPEALVWGGDGAPGTGGRYCVCTASATEICNGIDDDCDGIVDADAAVPAPDGIAGVSFAAVGGGLQLIWPNLPDASSYDVVRGDLTALRASGGNFATATIDCLADGTNPPLTDTTSSPADSGYWYLVRGNNCVGSGSYDDPTVSSPGARNSGILASGQGCP